MYKEMYYHLFNALTDALEQLENGQVVLARDILMRAQIETEEMYMDGDGADLEDDSCQ